MSIEPSASSRTEVGPLQAVAAGPDETVAPTFLSVAAARCCGARRQLGDPRPRHVRDGNVIDRLREGLHGRVEPRALCDYSDAAVALLVLVEAIGILLELGVEGQVPAALR